MFRRIRQVLGSCIFSCYMIVVTVITAGSTSLLMFFLPRSFHDAVIRFWCKLIFFGLRHFCGITYQVEGWENLPTDTACIIVCKHQSAWDTMIFPIIFQHPAFVIKQELVRVPCYGWELKNGSCIPIAREAGASSLKQVIRHSKVFLAAGQNLVIYPQGTRVPLGATVEQYPYKPGFVSIFETTKYPIVPAALNAGLFWHKKQFLKNAGVITLRLLPAIPYDPQKSKNELLQEVMEIIETNTDSLVKEAREQFKIQ